MTESELEETAHAVRDEGDAKLLDRICDWTESRREGLVGPERLRGGLKTERTDGVDRLVRRKLAVYSRGKARATGRGFSVSTRLIVMRVQQR